MYEAMENISEWCESATKHLEKEASKYIEGQEAGQEPEQDQPQKPAD